MCIHISFLDIDLVWFKRMFIKYWISILFVLNYYIFCLNWLILWITLSKNLQIQLASYVFKANNLTRLIKHALTYQDWTVTFSRFERRRILLRRVFYFRIKRTPSRRLDPAFYDPWFRDVCAIIARLGES